jgi:hypothetical protein
MEALLCHCTSGPPPVLPPPTLPADHSSFVLVRQTAPLQPSKPALFDLQPFGKGRRRNICKLCSTQYMSQVNQLRCQCVAVNGAPRPRGELQPPRLDAQPWQQAHLTRFSAWWDGLLTTDAANMLNCSLHGGIRAQICTWWALTHVWAQAGALHNPEQLLAWPEVQAVATDLGAAADVIVAGALSK